MKVKYAIVADCAFKSDTGKMNVLGIFSRIIVSSLPVLFGRLTVALGIEGEATDPPGRKLVSIHLLNPEGQILLTCEVGFDMPVSVRPLAEIVSEWPPIMLDSPGDYVIRVEAPDAPPHEIPLEVLVIGQ